MNFHITLPVVYFHDVFYMNIRNTNVFQYCTGTFGNNYPTVRSRTNSHEIILVIFHIHINSKATDDFAVKQVYSTRGRVRL